MRVCLLSRSAIADDPRVRRQGDALAGAGYDVVAIGLEGAASPPPGWKIVSLPEAPHRARARAALGSLEGAVGLTGARHLFWNDSFNRSALDCAIDAHADIYQANDWNTLPIASAAARAVGARYFYDSHEWAVDDRSRDVFRRIAARRYVHSIEARYVRDAAVVTTVSVGIAMLLRDRYGLSATPAVIRNVPSYEACLLRPPTNGIEVLYHGLIAPDRAVDALVASVPQWRPEFRLVVRGDSGDAGYLAELAELARRPGAIGRVVLEPPIPMVDLVQRANASDIGVFLAGHDRPQLRYSLPNKIFEYMMAGLAVCSSAVPEVAELVKRFDVGRLVEQPDVDSIAAAINAFDATTVSEYKRHSLEAARELCWEHEQETFLALYDARVAE